MISDRDTYHCPKCDTEGIWRNGVGFEAGMRCPTCSETWCPQARQNEIRWATMDMESLHGDGI